MLGLEHKAWLDEQGFGNAKVRAGIQNVLVAATWFPGGDRPRTGGIYLKAGAGFAHGRFTVFDNASSGVDTSSVEAHLDESGLGMSLGGGYEWRVAPALSVGTDVTVNYQRVRKLAFDHNWYVPVALGLNWSF
jgi:opacity protein-like surface antigen